MAETANGTVTVPKSPIEQEIAIEAVARALTSHVLDIGLARGGLSEVFMLRFDDIPTKAKALCEECGKEPPIGVPARPNIPSLWFNMGEPLPLSASDARGIETALYRLMDVAKSAVLDWALEAARHAPQGVDRVSFGVEVVRRNIKSITLKEREDT